MLSFKRFSRSVGKLYIRCLTMASSLLSGVRPNNDPPGYASIGGPVLPDMNSFMPVEKPSGPMPLNVPEANSTTNSSVRRLFSRARSLGQPLSAPKTHDATPETMPTPSEALLSPLFQQTVQQLCSKYGSVGLSAGFLDGSQTVDVNYGTRDGSPDTPTTRDTVYLISSMTKAITALAIAIMANDKEFGTDFDTEVREVFPQLSGRTYLRHAQRELTLADLIDNRTEFLRSTNLWESPDGEVPWKTCEPIRSLLQHLPLNDRFVKPEDFRHARNYFNEGFALAADILEKRTGMSWADFVRDKILGPLGMASTFTCITPAEEARFSGRIARSFTVSVTEPLKGIQRKRYDLGFRKFDYDAICQFVEHSLPSPEPVQINLSEAATGTPLAPAAGIMSSVSDMLKFYAKLIEVHHLPPYRKRGIGFRGLSEVERGMVKVLDHIHSMTETGSCAYSAGWNTANVPWDPTQVSPNQPRWPGADGDNSRRIEKAASELNLSKFECNFGWPFFQSDRSHDGCNAKTDAFRSGGAKPRLVLNHGGNMVGATSFCMVDLERKQATVVLSNTRGFFVDVPNLVGMLMSSQGAGGTDLMHQCAMSKLLGCYIASTYLWDVYRYEEALAGQYPILADPKVFAACIGRYMLVDGIFATVSVSQTEVNDGVTQDHLTLRLYDSNHLYPLRVWVGTTPEGPSVRMTFAMSMKDLVKTGVGGSNRLDVEDFVLEFRLRDQGLFQEFMWKFDRTGAKSADPSHFAFKRVHDGMMALRI